MFDKIIKFSLKNRFFVVALTIWVIMWWLYSMLKLPVDVLPDLNRPRVTVFAEVEWWAPEEVESLVTSPIERGLNWAPWVIAIRSVSSIWLWIINVEFDWWTDVYKNRQIVTEKLQSISLPKSTKTTIWPTTSLLWEIVWAWVTSPSWTVSPMELRSIADWTIRQKLLTIPWVANVLVMWWDPKQYQILIKPEKLSQYWLTMDEVYKAVQNANENRWWWFLIEGSKEAPIRIIARSTVIDELKKIVVKESAMDTTNTAMWSSKKVISVADVADVVFAPDPNRRWDATIMGKPWVILRIIKQPDVNTLELTKKIDEAFVEMQKSMPNDVKITTEIFKQEWFIDAGLKNVEEALRDSFIMVAIIITLFLMNLRTTSITLISIPLSLLTTFVIFKLMGLGINVMTLWWLAVAIWELVDDSIVDVENIFRRLRENFLLPKEERRSILKTIFEASSEVRNSIVYATILVVIVFIPFLLMPWVDGRLLAPIWIAYITSLVASLFVSMTVVPVLCYYLLPKYLEKRAEKFKEKHDVQSTLPIWFEADDTSVIKKVKKLALIPINLSLRFPKFLLFLALWTIPLSIVLYLTSWKQWLPEFNEPTFTSMMFTPVWSSLEHTKDIVNAVTNELTKIKGVTNVVATVWRADADAHANWANSAEFEIHIDIEKRKKKDIQNDIQKVYDWYKNVAVFSLGQPITHRMQELVSWIRSPIALKLYWKDLDVLQSEAQKILQIMQTVPWVVNAQVEKEQKIPQIAIYMDRNNSLNYWVNVWMLSENLEMAFMGMQAFEIIDWNERYPLIVKFDPSWRWDMNTLGNTLIPTSYDKQVTLNQLSEIQRTKWQNTISHDGTQRRILIYWFVKDRDVVSIVEDIKSKIEKQWLPEWYFVSYEWDYKAQKESSQRLMIIGLVVLMAVCVVLYWHLRSWNFVWQVLLSVVTAFLGWMIAIKLTWNVVSTAHFIWFISLIWIVSRNGIMLISRYIDLMKHENMAWWKDLVIRWSLERVVPVMMTALTASLALVPLLLAWDATWKEILNPLATVIFGWLIFSTLIEMFIRPGIFYRFSEKSIQHSIDAKNPELF